jgi:hypothetical protein
LSNVTPVQENNRKLDFTINVKLISQKQKKSGVGEGGNKMIFFPKKKQNLVQWMGDNEEKSEVSNLGTVSPTWHRKLENIWLNLSSYTS